MKKDQLLGKLERAWADLQDSYAGLTDAQLTQPGVSGEWSVKDILAHVTAWEKEALRYLPVIQAGKRPPRYSLAYGGIDAFNAQVAAEKRAESLSSIRADMEDIHRRLIAYVADAPDEQITAETRFRRRLRLDTYSHYREHEKAIRVWRARAESDGQA